jgi:4-amino-4-deoxy-L-arabinose transferase-like glycosyltransferase
MAAKALLGKCSYSNLRYHFRRAQRMVAARAELRDLQKAAFLLALALSIRIIFLFHTNNTGTDAWARYTAALLWAQKPDHLPSDVWLPLPFWILGGVLRFWPTESAARIFTLLLGTVTILPFYGVAKTVYSPRFAFYASVVFVCLGLHIGYSVSTTSEVPTLLLLIVGTYCWLRFRTDPKPRWFITSAVAFNAAALCRYEAWLFIPLIGIFIIVDFRHVPENHSLSKRVRTGIMFTLLASLSSIAWSLFCIWKWGDPLAPAHKTAWMNVHRPSLLKPGIIHKGFAVPGDLVGTLGPVVFALSIVGIVKAINRRNVSSDLAIMAVVMAAFHYFNAAVNGATMARYTLMYNWLFVIFCFYGVQEIGAKWSLFRSRAGLLFILAFFVVWQSGLVLGANYAPCPIADKLGSVSATVPLRCELRQAISWLNMHLTATDSVIVDDVQYESMDVIRFSKVASLRYFRTPYMAEDTDSLLTGLGTFVQANHPGILVYSPRGQLGRIWRLPRGETAQFVPGFDFKLCELWQNGEYRVYQITYGRLSSPR